MSQMYMLLAALLGVAAVGSLLSGGDDEDEDFDKGTPVPDIPFKDGTDGADTIEGTDGAELIRGLAGNDSIDAGEGDDWVYAGRGNDTVAADAGNDQIYLGGNDDVYGTEAPAGDEGWDTIYGGSGNDTIRTHGGDHLIWGDDEDGDLSGDDLIVAEGGQVVIRGGDGHDTIAANDDAGTNSADTLYGGNGHDRITVGAGDHAEGGEGDDRYLLTAGETGSTIVFTPEDRLVIQYQGPAETPPRIELVQAGDDVQVIADGDLLTTLKDVSTDDVRFEVSAQPPAPSGGGFVPPVTDVPPVVVSD